MGNIFLLSIPNAEKILDHAFGTSRNYKYPTHSVLSLLRFQGRTYDLSVDFDSDLFSESLVFLCVQVFVPCGEVGCLESVG